MISNSHIQYNHQERIDELNDRIFSRNYTDSILPTSFHPRPVMTKYSRFPIVDRRSESSVSIPPPSSEYVVGSASITAPAPFETFQRQIAVESDLRNQSHSLSSAPHRHYVPSSSSDLYHVPSVSGSLLDPQPFPFLFDHSVYGNVTTFTPLGEDVGSDSFFNSTRSQLRGGGNFAR